MNELNHKKLVIAFWKGMVCCSLLLVGSSAKGNQRGKLREVFGFVRGQGSFAIILSLSFFAANRRAPWLPEK